MDREIFIERVMRGEKLELDEVVKNQAQDELKSIEAEAVDRLETERRRQKEIELREAQFVEMVELAEQAAKIFAENVENEQRRIEVLRTFAEIELKIHGRYHQTFSKFSQIFHNLSGEAYDFRRVSNPILIELKNRGAVLDNLDIEITRRPLSPMAQTIADERYYKKA